jgi:hypothetical protein
MVTSPGFEVRPQSFEVKGLAADPSHAFFVCIQGDATDRRKKSTGVLRLPCIESSKRFGG